MKLLRARCRHAGRRGPGDQRNRDVPARKLTKYGRNLENQFLSWTNESSFQNYISRIQVMDSHIERIDSGNPINLPGI